MDQRLVEEPPSHDSGLSQPPFLELVLEETTWLWTRTFLARPGLDKSPPDLCVTKVREEIVCHPPICRASVDQV